MQSLPRGLSFGTEIEYDIVVPHDTSGVPHFGVVLMIYMKILSHI